MEAPPSPARKSLGAPAVARRGFGAGGVSSALAAPIARPVVTAASESGRMRLHAGARGRAGSGTDVAAAWVGKPRADGGVHARFEHRVERGNAAQLSVGVGVAVGVAQRDVAPQRRRFADGGHFAVLHGDHRRPGLCVDHGPRQRLAGITGRGREAVVEVRCACTGKRDSVRPVTALSSSWGVPPSSCARSITDST